MRECVLLPGQSIKVSEEAHGSRPPATINVIALVGKPETNQ